MKLSKHVNRESKNGKLVWHKGPPPHVGWWPASSLRNLEMWRWWDGKAWSCAVSPESSLSFVIKNAKKRSVSTGIEWNDSYPAHARVPRYDPRG